MPFVGDIVLYHQGDVETYGKPEGTNGTRVHPAMVTRAWPNGAVNLCVFFDGHGPSPVRHVEPEGKQRRGSGFWTLRPSDGEF